jgi:hypothetical protein
MQIGLSKKFLMYVGRDFPRMRSFVFEVYFGWRNDAKMGEISWHYYWRWSPRWPVRFIRVANMIYFEYGFGLSRRMWRLK